MAPAVGLSFWELQCCRLHVFQHTTANALLKWRHFKNRVFYKSIKQKTYVLNDQHESFLTAFEKKLGTKCHPLRLLDCQEPDKH